MPDTKTELNVDDEAALIDRWLLADDTAALARLASAHAPHLKRLARKAARGNNELADDLVQDANELFILALGSFDRAKGRLAAYIHKRVGLDLNAKVRVARSIVKPVRVGGKWAATGTNSLTHEEGFQVDPLELADEGKVVPPTGASPAMSDDRAIMLDVAIRDSDLSWRERRVLEARHGQHEKLSRIELAREFEVSETRVRQIEDAAMRKITSHIAGQQARIQSRIAGQQARI